MAFRVKKSASGLLSGIFLLLLGLEWLVFMLQNAGKVNLQSQIEMVVFLLVGLTAGVSALLIWNSRSGILPDWLKRILLPIWLGWFLFLLFCLWLRLNSQPEPGDLLYPFARLAEMAEWIFLFPVTTLLFFTFSKIRTRAMRWAGWFALVIALALLAFKVKSDGSLVFPMDADQFPVLWQLSLAVMLSGLLTYLIKRFGKNKTVDLLLFILIWVCAGLVWTAAPIGRDYYSLQPGPPTYRVMPESDAEMYDYEAARIALGSGEAINLSSRGILLEFYAALKLIIGFDSQSLMTVQAGLLGCIPALIYLIGVQLGSRPTGLLAAFLVIAKERNAIVSDLDFIHVKSLMTEPLMQAGVLLMVVWLIHTIKSKPYWFKWLVYGALAGILINVRPNAALLLFIPFFYLLIQFKRKPLPILNFSLILALGFTLAISPIVMRNITTGNNPLFFSAKFGILTDKLGFPKEVGDFFSPPKYSDNKQVRESEFRTKGNNEIIAPLSVNSLLNSFSRMAIHTLNITPHYLPGELFLEDENVDPNRLLDPQRGVHFLTILLNLSLILAGIRALADRDWQAGLAPLVIFLFYFPTVFLSSHAHIRHLAPIENLAMLYYSAGLMVAIKGFFPKLGLDSETNMEIPRLDFAWLVPLVVLFAMALPGVELIAPKSPVENISAANFEDISPSSLEILEKAGVSQTELTSFLLENSGAELMRGKIFYPQFSADRMLGRVLENRLPNLSFRLVDSYYVTNAYLPLEQEPRQIQNGETVLLLACPGSAGSKIFRGSRLILVEDFLVLPDSESPFSLDCGEPR